MTSFMAHYFPGMDPLRIRGPELREFLSQDFEESQTLEYLARHMVLNEDGSEKKPRNLKKGGNKKDQRETPEYRVGWKAVARVVAAFANAEGGLLVLGVDEREEPFADTEKKIRIYPGDMTPFPASITRESIQQRLNGLIRFEIEGLHIYPVRLASNEAVYLIDVPQSQRAPHRVDDKWYFQRYNFECLQMTHYQIADAFGRRLAPDLDVTIASVDRPYEGRHVRIRPVFLNKGRNIAKHAYCRCVLACADYVLTSGSRWSRLASGREAGFTVKYPAVLYPGVPNGAPVLEFMQCDNLAAYKPLLLQFKLYAEGMPCKDVGIKIDPVREKWSRVTVEEGQVLEERLEGGTGD